jgi:hypothetical protein
VLLVKQVILRRDEECLTTTNSNYSKDKLGTDILLKELMARTSVAFKL